MLNHNQTQVTIAAIGQDAVKKSSQRYGGAPFTGLNYLFFSGKKYGHLMSQNKKLTKPLLKNILPPPIRCKNGSKNMNQIQGIAKYANKSY